MTPFSRFPSFARSLLEQTVCDRAGDHHLSGVRTRPLGALLVLPAAIAILPRVSPCGGRYLDRGRNHDGGLGAGLICVSCAGFCVFQTRPASPPSRRFWAWSFAAVITSIAVSTDRAGALGATSALHGRQCESGRRRPYIVARSARRQHPADAMAFHRGFLGVPMFGTALVPRGRWWHAPPSLRRKKRRPMRWRDISPAGMP